MENLAYYGAGLECSSSPQNAAPVIEDCQFFGNTARGSGGGLGVESFSGGPPVTVRRCTFARNSADGGAAAIDIMTESASIEQCTFAENTASGFGVNLLRG